MKILYTFDEQKKNICISRTASSVQVNVLGEGSNLLGITDIYTCLQSIADSSPEIISNLELNDYAVYSTDFSEPGFPAVGHGLFSWIFLSSGNALASSNQSTKDILKARDNNVSILGIPYERLTIGRICSNQISVFSSGGNECLEVKITLSPVSSFTQKEYLISLDVYKSLSQFLPANFDHPAWTRFVTDSKLLEKALYPTNDRDNGSISLNRTGPTRVEIKSNEHVNGRSKREYSMSTGETAEKDIHILAKRQRSEPSPVFSGPTESYNGIEQDLSNVNMLSFNSQHPMFSPRNIFPDSDITIGIQSPTIIHKFSADGHQHPLSVPDPIQFSLSENTSSPIPPSPAVNQKLQTRSVSLSIPASDPSLSNIQTPHISSMSETSNYDKVSAKGIRKAKKSDKLPKNYLLYCENCGQVESSAWRRSKSMSGGVEQVFRLCNPCGLWLQSKKTMRPRERWEKDRKLGFENDFQVDKDKKRTLVGTNGKKRRTKKTSEPEKQGDTTDKAQETPTPGNGPTIAEQLALNVSRVRRSNIESNIRTFATHYREPSDSSKDENSQNAPSLAANQVTNLDRQNAASDADLEVKPSDSDATRDTDVLSGNIGTDPIEDSNNTAKKKDNKPKKSLGRPRRQKKDLLPAMIPPRNIVPLIPADDRIQHEMIPKFPPITQSKSAEEYGSSTNRKNIKSQIVQKQTQRDQSGFDEGTEKNSSQLTNHIQIPMSVPDPLPSLPLDSSHNLGVDDINALLSTPKPNGHQKDISDKFLDDLLSGNIYSPNTLQHSSNGSPSKWMSYMSSPVLNGLKGYDKHGPEPTLSTAGSEIEPQLELKHSIFEDLVSELGVTFGHSHTDQRSASSEYPNVPINSNKSWKTGRALESNITLKSWSKLASSSHHYDNINDINKPMTITDEHDTNLTSEMTLPSSPPRSYYMNTDNWSDEETPADYET